MSSVHHHFKKCDRCFYIERIEEEAIHAAHQFDKWSIFHLPLVNERGNVLNHQIVIDLCKNCTENFFSEWWQYTSESVNEKERNKP